MNEKSMSILDHLEELRKVLIICFISLIPTTFIGWFYARKWLLEILVEPVKSLNQKLVYLGMTEAFMVELKIAIIAGFVLASPIIFWQLWSFVLPALKANEKRYIIILVPSSIILFAGGVVFGYTTIFKYGIEFFLGFATDGLTPMLSLSQYLSFTFWFLLPFGLMFEMPLVMFFLAKIGLVNHRFLSKNRRYALFIITVIAAVATPTTDIISMLAMAVPMLILYEISIIIVRFVKPRSGYDEIEEEVQTVDVPTVAAAEEPLEEVYRNIKDRGNPEAEDTETEK